MHDLHARNLRTFGGGAIARMAKSVGAPLAKKMLQEDPVPMADALRGSGMWHAVHLREAINGVLITDYHT